MTNAAALAKMSPVLDAPSFGEARAALGEMIGLGKPAPANVTARVINDVKYARLVAGVGHLPDWRDKILADPLNAQFDAPEFAADGADQTSIPVARHLVGKFAASIVSWGAGGFKLANADLMAQRRSACGSCVFNSETPDRGLYKLARAVARDDKSMCTSCGCLIAKKTALLTEQCPEPSPENPLQTRWGDPMPGKV